MVCGKVECGPSWYRLFEFGIKTWLFAELRAELPAGQKNHVITHIA